MARPWAFDKNVAWQSFWDLLEQENIGLMLQRSWRTDDGVTRGDNYCIYDMTQQGVFIGTFLAIGMGEDGFRLFFEDRTNSIQKTVDKIGVMAEEARK